MGLQRTSSSTASEWCLSTMTSLAVGLANPVVPTSRGLNQSIPNSSLSFPLTLQPHLSLNKHGSRISHETAQRRPRRWRGRRLRRTGRRTSRRLCFAVRPTSRWLRLPKRPTSRRLRVSQRPTSGWQLCLSAGPTTRRLRGALRTSSVHAGACCLAGAERGADHRHPQAYGYRRSCLSAR